MKIFKYIIFISILISLFFVIYRQSDKKGFSRWRISFKTAVLIAASVAGLIPVNPEMSTATWHHRNNELLFQLSSEFVELMRIQRRPPPKPPPIGDGSRGTKRRESRYTKMKSCKKQR